MSNTPTINGRAVLTTGQVAEICHVAPRTVSKWFDAGQLGGYRIPGSRDRRIPAEQLLTFMEEHGIPSDGLDRGTCRVLIIDPAPYARQVAGELSGSDRYEVRTAATEFEAGVLAQELAPHVVVLNAGADAGADADGAARTARKVKATATLGAPKLVGVAEGLTAERRRALLSNGFDACLAGPYSAAELIGAIERATDMFA